MSRSLALSIFPYNPSLRTLGALPAQIYLLVLIKVANKSAALHL